MGAVGQLTRRLWPSGLPFRNSPRIKHKPMRLYVDQTQDAKVFALLQNKGAVWTVGQDCSLVWEPGRPADEKVQTSLPRC